MVLRVRASVRVGGRVRWLERSPDGLHLVAALDLRHPVYAPVCSPIVGLARGPSGLAITCTLREPALAVFALDDGAVIRVAADDEEVVLHRHDATDHAWRIAGGQALDTPQVALLASGREMYVAIGDRDDGHGYTEPVYSTSHQTIDLRTGAAANAHAPGGVVRGPGVSTLSPHAADPRVAAVIARFPFRQEWAICVGPTRLLTTSRLIAWHDATTLRGDAPASWVGRAYLDLSADERLVAAPTATGIRIERDDGVDDLVLGSSATCAIFLGATELAVGTAGGDVHVLAL